MNFTTKAFTRALEDTAFLALTREEREERAGGIVLQLTDEEIKNPLLPAIDASAFEPVVADDAIVPVPVSPPPPPLPMAVEAKILSTKGRSNAAS